MNTASKPLDALGPTRSPSFYSPLSTRSTDSMSPTTSPYETLTILNEPARLFCDADFVRH